MVGVRRGHHPAGDGFPREPVRRGHDGFPPSRERRWLAFGAVTLTPPGMDSRLRGNDGGWRSARSPSPPPGMDSRLRGNDGGWRSARSPSFGPAGDGFPPSRERRWLAFGAVTLTPPGMDSRLRGNDGGWRSARSFTPPGMDSRLRGNDGGWRSARSPSPRRGWIPAFVGVRRGHPHPGNDGGWRSARSPSPRRGWIPAFAGTTVVGVRRGHSPSGMTVRPGDGFPPSRERRWLAFGAVTLTPPGMDSRLRGNDGGWRSARSPSPRRGWIPAFAGTTVVGVRRGHPRHAGDGFPPSRERRWLAFGADPSGMDSRLRGNDGGWRSARSPSPRRGWIPAFAGMTVVGVRRGHPRPRRGWIPAFAG